MRSARLDHPRSRGVYPREVGAASLTAGSSPLARGLQRPHVQGVGRQGIIPARAGFTDAERRLQEHYPGSSPLARGLLERPHELLSSGGIIPARAGFTQGNKLMGDAHRDHPRSRGVYGNACPVHAVGRGIIPARAGFTSGSRS